MDTKRQARVRYPEALKEREEIVHLPVSHRTGEPFQHSEGIPETIIFQFVSRTREGGTACRNFSTCVLRKYRQVRHGTDISHAYISSLLNTPSPGDGNTNISIETQNFNNTWICRASPSWLPRPASRDHRRRPRNELKESNLRCPSPRPKTARDPSRVQADLRSRPPCCAEGEKAIPVGRTSITIHSLK